MKKTLNLFVSDRTSRPLTLDASRFPEQSLGYEKDFFTGATADILEGTVDVHD